MLFSYRSSNIKSTRERNCFSVYVISFCFGNCVSLSIILPATSARNGASFIRSLWKNGHLKKINERPTFSFQSCRANQSFQLSTSSAKKSQLKLRDRYKKFLPAASIFMTFSGVGSSDWNFLHLVQCQGRLFTVSCGINCDLYPLLITSFSISTISLESNK